MPHESFGEPPVKLAASDQDMSTEVHATIAEPRHHNLTGDAPRTQILLKASKHSFSATRVDAQLGSGRGSPRGLPRERVA